MPSPAISQATPSPAVINFATEAKGLERSNSHAKVRTVDKGCPPVIATRQKSSRVSANFETMFEWLYDEKMKEATKRLRRIRRARGKDAGAAGVFGDAIDAIKQCHCAHRRLKEKNAKLPDNQKIVYPEVSINALTSRSHPIDVDRYFSNWIKEAEKQANLTLASCLLDQRNYTLKQLKLNHQAVLKDQKLSGLWQLRVEADAAANVANRLTFEASETKLRTVADCAAAAGFLGVLCREDIYHSDDLNAYVVKRLSKRLVECLSSLEGRMR